MTKRFAGTFVSIVPAHAPDNRPQRTLILGEARRDGLRRRKASPLSTTGTDDSDVNQAPTASLQSAVAIDELDDIAGLARSAVEHGGSLEEVALILGLSRQAARDAYEKR